MTAFLITLHILVCIVLILFVLLQPGARGGVGAAFGGAGGQTVFGGRGANTFLAKLTAVAAVIFMITCISLSYFVSHTTSVMHGKATTTAPGSEDGTKGDTKAGDTKAGDTKAGDTKAGDTKAGDTKAGDAPKPDAPKPDAPKPAAPPPPAP
jgi:preprotein translocase subunit SecG